MDLSGHDHDDGCMEWPVADCQMCNYIRQFPCMWCGFGIVFTTHNPEAHESNGDAIASRLGSEQWMELFDVYVPYVECPSQLRSGAHDANLL
jgi:hypothetical protein